MPGDTGQQARGTSQVLKLSPLHWTPPRGPQGQEGGWTLGFIRLLPSQCPEPGQPLPLPQKSRAWGPPELSGLPHPSLKPGQGSQPVGTGGMFVGGPVRPGVRLGGAQGLKGGQRTWGLTRLSRRPADSGVQAAGLEVPWHPNFLGRSRISILLPPAVISIWTEHPYSGIQPQG